MALLSFSGMVGSFGVLLHIFLIKKYIFKLSLGVHFALIKKMAGGRVTALATRQQRFSFDPIPKFHGADEAIAVEAVAFLCTCKIPRRIGRQHTPGRRRETYGQARQIVAK